MTSVLGHWPSASEILQANFPDWIIWRERDGGTHGLWQAQRADGSRHVAAQTTEELRVLMRGRL